MKIKRNTPKENTVNIVFKDGYLETIKEKEIEQVDFSGGYYNLEYNCLGILKKKYVPKEITLIFKEGRSRLILTSENAIKMEKTCSRTGDVYVEYL